MATYYNQVLSGAKVSLDIYNGDAAYNTTVKTSAALRVSSGGYVENTTVHDTATFSNGGLASATFLSGGTMLLLDGGSAEVVSVLRNAKLIVNSGGVATGIYVSSGNVTATVYGDDNATLIDGTNERGSFFLSGGTASNFMIYSTGMLTVSSGGTALGTVISNAGSLTVSLGGVATGIIQNPGGRLTVTVRGGDTKTEIAGSHVSGTFYQSGCVASHILLDENAAQYVLSGGTALHTIISSGWAHQYVSSGGVASATSVYSKGSMTVYGGGVARDAVVYAGGSMMAVGGDVSGARVEGLLQVTTATTGADESSGKGALRDITVVSGGTLNVATDGVRLEDTTVVVGGSLTFAAGAYTGKRLTLDFADAPGNSAGLINDLSRISDETVLLVTGVSAAGTYLIADEGCDYIGVHVKPNATFQASLFASGGCVDVFGGMTYAFNAEGTSLDAETWSGGQTVLASASPIDETMQVGDYDYAAVWSGAAVSSGSRCDVVGSDIDGNAWLTLDGATILGGEANVSSGAALYGTPDGVALYGGVYLKATGGTVIGNLAAGAGASGGVLAVGLVIDDATVKGVGYAGGFGDVGELDVFANRWVGDVSTEVRSGTFEKDFYAGALANFARTGVATNVGEVTLTVENGTFKGNLYGASAVKAGAEGQNVHRVEGVNITLDGGSAVKNDFCLFCGGYATGGFTDTAYSVGKVDLAVNGGVWGGVHGGRGVFGGIFASMVVAQVIDEDGDFAPVNISISGGTMGNVYGGGWAQKGGTSIVGDVNISIAGGTIANVFGGGTHSIMGAQGTTSARNVTITVSGGDITGNIYARGQAAGDDVTGAARVIFTGATDFECGVWGYSCVDGGSTGTDDDVTLRFTGYAGRFSGGIGGFNGITFDGDSAMTLATAAADVSNGKWEFDLSDRDAALSGTSLLTWEAESAFSGKSVKVAFANATQAAAGWSIATAAFAGATFELWIGSDKIAGDIAYDTPISGGDWDGWKLTDDEGTLKFKQLA